MRLVTTLLLAGASTLSATAFAQDAPPPANDAAPARTADATPSSGADIVVTAQRRSQNLLSVPLSITAVRGETLQQTGITDITSLRFNTPGFISVSGTGYTQIYIRGIGNRIFVGADPSVATFIDDVPRVYASLVDDLVNVERVEVLKGAQGGLYGRNATGGVVNIITRQPGDKFAAEGRISYGSKKTFDANLYVNLPLNDNVAFNFTASRKSHDDYVRNKSVKNPYAAYAALSPQQAAAFGDTGQRAFLIANPNLVAALDAPSRVSRMNNQSQWYVDAKLRFRGDGFKVTLAADWSQNDDANGNGWQITDPVTTYNNTYRGIMGAFASDPTLSTAGRILGGVLGVPVNPTGAILPFDYVYPKHGKFETNGSITHHSLQSDYGASAKADIDMPGFTLTSITAFRWNHSQFRGDTGVGAVPIAGFETNFKRRFFFQEIRMVSNADGPFRWLAGATYFHEKIQNSLAPVVLGYESPPTLATTGTNAFSGYVQGEYNVTDQLKIIASLRYITEKKTAEYPGGTIPVYNYANNTPINGIPAGATSPVVFGPASGSTGAHKFLPAVTLSYGLPNGGNVYARWARGLKTGGINPLVHPGQTLGKANAFKPEEVDTYEIGLKSNLFDRKVQLTAAIFYNNFKNLQITRTGYPGLTFVLVNAGKARTYGGEIAVNWQVAPIFNIAANLGYLNAKYQSFSCGPVGGFCIQELASPSFNFSGNHMVQSPKWQGGLTANLDMPVTDNWNLAGTILYSYMSSFFFEDSNAPVTRQKGFSLVNLRLGAHTADKKLGAYLSVKNLFNKRYSVFGTANYQIPGAPRIISGVVEVKF
jgi:outer membrane receptor protein involved in Fe transport